MGAFAAYARLLDAPERDDLGRDDALVDANHAVFERLPDAPGTAEITRVEITGKAELGVVRHGDRILFGREAEERRHRAEGLLAGDEQIGLAIAQQRRLEEVAAERLAAGDDLGALGDG